MKSMTQKRRTKAQVQAERAAFHEAGHAVMAWLVGAPVEYIEMTQVGESGARTSIGPYRGINKAIDISLAGLAAARLHEHGRTPDIMLRWEAEHDLREARAALVESGVANIDASLAMTGRVVKQWLQEYWHQVRALAALLIPGAVIDGETVTRVIEAA